MAREGGGGPAHEKEHGEDRQPEARGDAEAEHRHAEEHPPRRVDAELAPDVHRRHSAENDAEAHRDAEQGCHDVLHQQPTHGQLANGAPDRQRAGQQRGGMRRRGDLPEREGDGDAE